MSTVEDKDMWSMTLWNSTATGTTVIWHPHYASTEANRMPVTERLIIREVFAVNTQDLNWPAGVGSINFRLLIGFTEILNKSILLNDSDRDFIHIYRIGSVAVPVIAEKESLINMRVQETGTPLTGPIRMIYGAWGTWLRDSDLG